MRDGEALHLGALWYSEASATARHRLCCHPLAGARRSACIGPWGTSMVTLVVLQWAINAVAIVVAVKAIDGIEFAGRWWQMLILGAVFGIVNSLIRPVVRFLSYPIIVFTLGIFTLIINAAMLLLTSLISQFLDLGLMVKGFFPALLGAFVVSVVSTALSWLIRPEGKEGGPSRKKRSDEA